MSLRNQSGMTLMELTVVLLILIALAGLAIPYVGGTGRMAMCQATDATMLAVKEAIMGGASGPGFYGDLLGEYPRDRYFTTGYNLHYLFNRDNGLDDDSDTHNSDTINFDGVFDADEEWRDYNPRTGVGWRGPYLMSGQIPNSGIDSSFASLATQIYDPATNTSGKVHAIINDSLNAQAMDAWNRPIVLQVPYNAVTGKYELEYARLVSAGPGAGIAPGDAKIDTAIHNNPNASDRGDDRVLYLRMPDPYANGNIPCDQL
ncbi:hypothetical protein [Methylomarinum vadi]|uniref:hypothetical protein n=1 Tax=Methylomarinum vadi TaxID=438855 RepID=UPI00126820F1|nr:hypothetical protein [Methylomarinum vadi]